MRAKSLPVVISLLMTGLVLTGCSSSTPPHGAGGSGAGVTSTTVPQPAGKIPSPISKMVCSTKARKEISEALGVTPTRVSTPTWIAHRYSCAYVYPSGTMTLSVQELSSWSQTVTYFTSAQTQFGDTGPVANLGQGAFSESSGSVVVRKDWKILTVDVAGLPANFGAPPISSGDAAQTVADVILGCWDGD